MNNVMLDHLPTEWHGYEVNTDFRIGLQIYILQYDKEINKYEKNAFIIELLFGDREHPNGEELQECISWYLNGWYHDQPGTSKDSRRFIDYDVDQWRIYADFLQIYGIDLSVEDMHWWKFNGLMWNMPRKISSFMEVIEIRKKEIKTKMSAEEKKAIREAQQIYELDQPERQFSSEDKGKIDEFDQMMEEIRKRKKIEQEALSQFLK